MMESIEIWDSMHTMGLELSHEIQSSMDSLVLFGSPRPWSCSFGGSDAGFRTPDLP